MRNPKSKFICKQCSGEFYRYISKGGENRYCSHKCFGISERLDNHPNWKAGVSSHREKRLQYYREYYKKNKETITQQVKEYADKHKENKRIYNIEYRKRNRLRLNEIRKKDRKFNPEKYHIRNRNYRKRNNEKIRLWERCNNYMRRHNSPINPDVIQRVYEDNIKRFGTLTCILCDKAIIFGQDSVEHLLPVTRGGSNLYENIAIAHRSCNSEKNNKTMQEWQEYKTKVLV